MSLDLIIVIVYLVLMLGIGLYYRRYADKGTDNFFLAGRNVPGWLNGVSYAAAMVSADSATAYGGLAAVTGLFVCWWYLSRFGLALFVGGVLFAIFWRRLRLFTSMEFYELRFTGLPATVVRGWIAFRTSFIALPAWTGVTLLAACKILGPTLGLNQNETIALVVPIAFLNIFMAGYRGVVVSNFIQVCVFMSGAFCLAVFTVMHFGGPHGLTEAVIRQYGPKSGEILSSFPPVHQNVFPLAAAAAWMIGQTIGYGGDAAPMGGAMEGQRILSTRTPRQAVTMYITTAVTMFSLVMMVSLPCVAAAILWPHLRDPAADRELAYGLLMKKMLPIGALGLVVSAMMSGCMSVVGDNLNFGSQVMLNDFYRRWIVRDASDRHYLIAGKVCMLVILALALMVAYNAKIIFSVAVFMLQLSAAELPANWAQWWWWRFNGKARVAASFGGAAIFCLVVPIPALLVKWGVHGAHSLVLEWWWQTFLVMGLTTILWVAVALLTEPDPQPVLDEFYRRARPLGSWGPVRGRVVEPGSDADRTGSIGWKLIWQGFGIAALGAVGVMAYIVGFSNLYFGLYEKMAAFLVGSVVLLGVFFYFLGPYADNIDKQIARGSGRADEDEPVVVASHA